MSKTITLEVNDEDEFWRWVDVAESLNYESLESYIRAAVRQDIARGEKH